MTKISDALTYGLTIRESANDGSDFTNPSADYRRLFLGEDGQLHVKDSAGAVTDIGVSSGSVAADAIWDAKGDLAVGTGANTAQKLTAGANGTILMAASGETTGAKWAIGQTFCGAKVYNDAAISLSNNSLTALTFNTENFDTDVFHDTSTNSGRLTVPAGKGGYYQITGHVSFAANGNGTQRYVSLRVDGTTTIAAVNGVISGSASTDMVITTLVSLTAGQYVELMAYQDRGDVLDVNVIAGRSPIFEMALIGV